MAVVLHSLVAMVPLVLHGCGGPDDHGGATTTIPDGDKTTTTTTSTAFWCPGDKEEELAQPDGPFDHNGKSMKTLCRDKPEAHFFGIGDWGGDTVGHTWDNAHKRERQEPADSQAGVFVARQMNARASKVDPDVVLNAGDNFYPGGLSHHCGGLDVKTNTDPAKQFFNFLQTPFGGDKMKGKPWLSVLGNHDYGGYSHSSGWDYQIQHTWATGTPDGWRLPAQYWHQQVKYHGFAVDFFMLDSNIFDAAKTGDTSMCQRGGDCYGLTDDTCPGFFTKLWNDGVDWLEEKLKNSTAEHTTAEYKIVVTHFPPWNFVGAPTVHEKLAKIHSDYGIDLFFTGHTHQQEYGMDEKTGVPYIVSGGGGGITSEGKPSTDGNDDQYGFVDFTVNVKNLKIELFSWGGPDGENVHPRKTIILTQGNYSSPSKDLTV